VDSQGRIPVRVRSADPPPVTFTATLYPYALGSGTGPVIDTQALTQEGSTNVYSGTLDAGSFPDPAPGENNRYINVNSSVSGNLGHPFRVVHSASDCPSGSQTLVAAAARCQFCQEDEPAPAVLQLQLDAPVTAGSCADCDRLNQPTPLVHVQQAGYECCWLSEPIDFCADPTAPGFWMLRKSDARTWDLILQRGETEVARYCLQTQADNDCSFPITLQFVGGGAECQDWPDTITVSPAP
jgi:hypothetical protein